jgi:cyclase
MFIPRVIPVLLLKDKGLVKTIKFDKKRAKYIGDPINAVRIFNDLEADELIFLDINATKEHRTISKELVKNIGDEAFMPFAVGGGIRTLDDIKQLLAAGAEKVVINTMAIEDREFINKASAIFGNQSIIISIDLVKKRNEYLIYTIGGTKKAKISLPDYLGQIQQAGAGEIFINSIDRDGAMSGYDLEMIRFITSKVSVPVIACGGAGNLVHLKEAIDAGGASACAAGSMFVYHGSRNAVLINYPEKKELEKIFNQE